MAAEPDKTSDKGPRRRGAARAPPALVRLTRLSTDTRRNTGHERKLPPPRAQSRTWYCSFLVAGGPGVGVYLCGSSPSAPKRVPGRFTIPCHKTVLVARGTDHFG